MTQNKYNPSNIEIKRKNRISLKRSRSVVSMNSNKSIISTNALSKQLSLKRKRKNIESTSYKYQEEGSNKHQNGNLTSLEIHDSKGNIVAENQPISNKTDISHIHFGSNYESALGVNGSSSLDIDLSKDNYIPTAKPPKTPSIKSPVLEDWDPYNFLPSGSSNGGSSVTVNSIPNSVSDSISSIVKRIPAALRSSKSTNSSSLLDKQYWENYEGDLCIVDDVVHARRNKLQVKLNRVIAHSNKRLLDIFLKGSMEREREFTLSLSSSHVSPKRKNGFKIPARIHRTSEIPRDLAVQSLIKSDCDIIPQKLVVPDFKEKRTIHLSCSPFNCNKPKIHYVRRVTKRSKVINSVEKSKGIAYLVHKEQIFSPNTDLKDSANSPNYPGYISGFAALTIKDQLKNANSSD